MLPIVTPTATPQSRLRCSSRSAGCLALRKSKIKTTKTAGATRFHRAQLPPRLSQLAPSWEATKLFGSTRAREWLTLMFLAPTGSTRAFHVGLPVGTLAEGSMGSDGIDTTVSRTTCFDGSNLFHCECACIWPTLFLTTVL